MQTSKHEIQSKCVVLYTLRWLIEQYHYVLKNGCQIESLQLKTATRMISAVATYAIAAWRLLWLTYATRVYPQQSCEVAFENFEQALFCRFHLSPRHQKSRQPLRKRCIGGAFGVVTSLESMVDIQVQNPVERTH